MHTLQLKTAQFYFQTNTKEDIFAQEDLEKFLNLINYWSSRELCVHSFMTRHIFMSCFSSSLSLPLSLSLSREMNGLKKLKNFSSFVSLLLFSWYLYNDSCVQCMIDRKIYNLKTFNIILFLPLLAFFWRYYKWNS